jgi:MtN3 and saliva related transmembrane protein
MTSQIVVDAIGVGAALCSTTSFAPQLLKLIREKSGEAISIRMYALTVTAFSLWSFYGLMLKSWPLVLSNLVSLGLSSAILLLKWRYRDREHDRPATARR